MPKYLCHRVPAANVAPGERIVVYDDSEKPKVGIVKEVHDDGDPFLFVLGRGKPFRVPRTALIEVRSDILIIQ